MAEPFGIVAGAIGIASAFTACIDCFELTLNCARLRLTRWGESVNIYNDPKLGRQDATATEIQLAKDASLQILVLFADTENVSKKYKLNAKAGEDLSAYSTGDIDPKMVVLDNKMKGLAIQHTASKEGSALKDLLEQIVSLLDDIEKLFPAPQVRATPAQREAVAIGDKQALKLLEDAATGVDSLLQKTVKEVIAGHQYSNIGIKGQASLQGKEKAWGPEHTSTLNTVNNLGLLYADQGKLVEAEQMYQRALQGYEKAWGPDHTSTLDTVNNLETTFPFRIDGAFRVRV
ncbi:hypothetical protein DL95DRAFT_418908 [Leptodontidium sp. 2 PMI_412]|nr:hypothetical protein DL95DRAFT_418908 [Leptodontidium sp. 2 PMI_412]